MYLYEVRVGKKAINFGGTGHAVFNSGASVNYVPKTSYNKMMEIIKGDKTCVLTPTGLWACEGCSGIDDPSYPKIKVRLGSRNS